MTPPTLELERWSQCSSQCWSQCWSQWCFDCDGTILDSARVFTAAYERAVCALGGTPVSDYWHRRRAGESDARLCVVAGVRPADFEQYRRLRQEAFDTTTAVAPPFAAARPLFQRLRLLGLQVVVISYRSSAISLLRDLHEAGLSGYASHWYATKEPLAGCRTGSDDASAGKYEVLRRLSVSAPTVMVGDSESDIRAARSAGVSSIGLASGCSSARELLQAGADWVFPSVDHLYACLRSEERANHEHQQMAS